jgi:hypothetical protein
VTGVRRPIVVTVLVLGCGALAACGDPAEVVVDTASGQRVLMGELIVVGAAALAEPAIARHHGSIRRHVPETSTYEVRFPVSRLDDLEATARALRARGLTVSFAYVRGVPEPTIRR